MWAAPPDGSLILYLVRAPALVGKAPETLVLLASGVGFQTSELQRDERSSRVVFMLDERKDLDAARNPLGQGALPFLAFFGRITVLTEPYVGVFGGDLQRGGLLFAVVDAQRGTETLEQTVGGVG